MKKIHKIRQEIQISNFTLEQQIHKIFAGKNLEEKKMKMKNFVGCFPSYFAQFVDHLRDENVGQIGFLQTVYRHLKQTTVEENIFLGETRIFCVVYRLILREFIVFHVRRID